MRFFAGTEAYAHIFLYVMLYFQPLCPEWIYHQFRHVGSSYGPNQLCKLFGQYHFGQLITYTLHT